MKTKESVTKTYHCIQMWKKLAIVLVSLMWITLMVSESLAATQPDQDEPTLRNGKFFTPEQGAAYMKEKLAEYPTRESWERNVPIIREEILKGMGMVPLPKRTPLKAEIRGKRVMDGYTIENVVFQSIPGYYVTCNLFRPTHAGPYAVVINPHGHGSAGRLRAGIEARAAAQARMGAIALTVDMVGTGESPVPTTRHRSSTAMKLQVWNVMRAIDFVLTLEGTDEDRIGVTGCSGGGTQTFMATALDDRIDVSAPVAMVSSWFFGGCLCESGLPIHKSKRHDINNVVIAAMAAPRPMILVSDGGDWTSNTPEVEFPFIKHIYELMGVPDRVENVHFPEGRHDYNADKRGAVYPFLAKHLKLDLSKVQDEQGNITEVWLAPFDREKCLVFDETHPMPEDALKTPEAIEEALSSLQIER